MDNGFTQEAFAERIGMSYKYYQQVETGKQNELRLSTIDKFSEALGIEPSQLISAAPLNISLGSRRKSPHYNRKKLSKSSSKPKT